jgi:hypothetical protein
LFFKRFEKLKSQNPKKEIKTMKTKYFIATILITLFVFSPFFNLEGWGQQDDWASCIEKNLPATRRLVDKGILKRMIPCPPGVGGECFSQGARWNLFTQDNTEACSHLRYPAGSCQGWQGEEKVCIVAAEWYSSPRSPGSFIHSSNPPTISYVKRRKGSGQGITVSGNLNQTKVREKEQRAIHFGSKVFFRASNVAISLQPNPHGPGGRAVITKNVTHYWEFTYRDHSKTIIETIISLKDGTYNGNHASGDCFFTMKQKNVGANGTVTNFQDRTGVERWNAAYDPSKKETVLFLPGHDMNEWILR